MTGHDDLETLIRRSINKINTQQHGNEGTFYCALICFDLIVLIDFSFSLI